MERKPSKFHKVYLHIVTWARCYHLLLIDLGTTILAFFDSFEWIANFQIEINEFQEKITPLTLNNDNNLAKELKDMSTSEA